MDPTLSKTDAHKVFGDLYRKERPPELQQKVDEVVNSTSDVFVRIERIEELDKAHNRKRLSESDIRKDEGRRRRSGGGGRSGGRSGGAGAGSGQKAPPRKKGAAPEKNPGFFARLFGNPITRWGTRTGTLDGGFLALNPKLSDGVYQLFRGLTEEQIIQSVKTMRMIGTVAWEAMPPERYNAIVVAYQFLTEFIHMDPMLRRYESPREWVSESVKMQKAYALFLKYPNKEEVLLQELPNILSRSEKHKHLMDPLKKAVNFILGLEARTPTLKNAILVFYALAREKVVTWEEVENEIKPGQPVTDSYRAPDQVLAKIKYKISELKKKYHIIQDELQEIDDVKSRYFELDESGRLKTDFLNPIVKDVLRKTIGEGAASSESTVAAHKREPHRLLYCTLKDFDMNCLYLLSGTVNTRMEGHHSEEVMIFKQGLFRVYVDRYNAIFRDSEAFIKKYKDMSYTFTDFMGDLKTPTDDPVVRQFLDLAKRATEMYSEMVFQLVTVLNNHRQATDLDQMGKASDGLKKTKVLAVESFEAGPRFLPHADREIVSANRQNGKTVHQGIEDLVRQIYNYLYIFRDQDLTKTLASGPEKKKQLETVKEELKRLGEVPGE